MLKVNGITLIEQTLEKLNNAGIKVSLFINPDEKNVKLAKKTGAQIVELHTGIYAEAKTEEEKEKYPNPSIDFNGLVPVGINVLSPKNGYQKEEIMIIDELIFNINTKDDLKLAEMLLKNKDIKIQ